MFSSIGHPWQRIEWCGLLVIAYMIIKWLFFKRTWTIMTWLFNVTIKWLYFEQHDISCIIEDWLLCNDMDNIDIIISNDYEMIGIWRIHWKIEPKWLMYNDMGNVDHLPIYLHTCPPTYLLTYITWQMTIRWKIHVKYSITSCPK